MAGSMTDCDDTNRAVAVPDGIDHLEYTVADLEHGMDDIEKPLYEGYNTERPVECIN